MTDRFLMCPPKHFEVAYVINPWMEGNVAGGNNTVASRQWENLARLIGTVAQVDSIMPAAGVPDMVFTANAGLVLGNKCVPSRFRHPERQAEEPHFDAWFRQHGFDVLELPEGTIFRSRTEELCGFNVAGPKSRERRADRGKDHASLTTKIRDTCAPA